MAYPEQVTVKLQALRELIYDNVQTHDTSFKVKRSPDSDSVLMRATSRKDRVRIMGDPVRYVEVLYQSESEPPGEYFDAEGALCTVAHTFTVDVWYEYEPDSGSYDKWLRLMESKVQLTGLLKKLRETANLSYDDWLIDDYGDPLYDHDHNAFDASVPGGIMETQGEVSMETQGGATMVTQDSGSTTTTMFAGHLHNPSPAAMNVIAPLDTEGKERAHITSFTITVI